jgi:hypothetical protein
MESSKKFVLKLFSREKAPCVRFPRNDLICGGKNESADVLFASARLERRLS